MINYFLLIVNIEKIDLHIIDIKKHFIYLGLYFIYFIYLYFIVYLSYKYFNILKSVLLLQF